MTYILNSGSEGRLFSLPCLETTWHCAG